MNDLSERAARNLEAVRAKNPLVHSITNLVVMNYTANALLAMGASPVMAHSKNEVEEIVSLSGALVLNIGTLTADTVAAMITAGKKASEQNIPIILDPVGAGATRLRSSSAKKIIAEINVSVLRGNASEILALRYSDSQTKGVDSLHSVDDAVRTARDLAGKFNSIVAVTGPVDVITEGESVYQVSNGHPLMSRVTGTGCTATVIIGAFLAVDPEPLSAAVTGLAYFGLAGEIAAKSASAPGSFMIQLLDALYMITPDQLADESKIGIE